MPWHAWNFFAAGLVITASRSPPVLCQTALHSHNRTTGRHAAAGLIYCYHLPYSDQLCVEALAHAAALGKLESASRESCQLPSLLII